MRTGPRSAITVDDFFAGRAVSRRLFDAVAEAVSRPGKASVRVSSSQIAFRRSRNFAEVWVPALYRRQPSAPLVLTVSFPQGDRSPRWKQVAQVSSTRYTHHLELYRVGEVDQQVRDWLRAAGEAA